MTSWAQLNSSDSSPLADTRLGRDQGFNFQPRTWGCVTADSTSHAVGKGRKPLAHQPGPISAGSLHQPFGEVIWASPAQQGAGRGCSPSGGTSPTLEAGNSCSNPSSAAHALSHGRSGFFICEIRDNPKCLPT